MLKEFAEEIVAEISRLLETSVNDTLGSVRQFDDNRAKTAVGKVDAYNESISIIRSTYKKFINDESEKEENDDKSLY